MRNKSVASDSFIGRERELEELTQLVRERDVLLTGARRVGKTQLLKQLVGNPPAGMRPLRINLEGLTSIEGAVERIQEQLEQAGLGSDLTKLAKGITRFKFGDIVEVENKPPVSPWQRLEPMLHGAIRNLPDKTLLVLMFDEVPWWLDELRVSSNDGDRKARQALAYLRYVRQQDSFESRLRMILTGSVALSGLAREIDAAAEINDLVPFELAPMDEADAHALFEAEIVARNHSPQQDLESVCRAAYAVTRGSPHWLQQIVAKLPRDREISTQHIENAVQALLAPRMRHLFDDQWRTHLNKRHGTVRANILRAILRSASQSTAGQSLSILRTAALQAGLEGGRNAADEAVYTLVDEFYLDQDDDGGYRFFNPLFQRWCQRYGDV